MGTETWEVCYGWTTRDGRETYRTEQVQVRSEAGARTVAYRRASRYASGRVVGVRRVGGETR